MIDRDVLAQAAMGVIEPPATVEQCQVVLALIHDPWTFDAFTYRVGKGAALKPTYQALVTELYVSQAMWEYESRIVSNWEGDER